MLTFPFGGDVKVDLFFYREPEEAKEHEEEEVAALAPPEYGTIPEYAAGQLGASADWAQDQWVAGEVPAAAAAVTQPIAGAGEWTASPG